MNPSTALARVLVDELVRGGVRDAVLSPGSRSAPMAIALHAEPRIRLHVRLDERSAGFLALGIAATSGQAVPVLCTSGTATANLHPAVLEAAYAGVPLLVLTADRPPELRGTGANQTVDQVGLYGSATRLAVEVGVPAARIGSVAYWRSMTARAVAAAMASGDPGPVQLNLAFREPLVPDGDDAWAEPLDGRAGGGPWTAVPVDLPGPRPSLAAVLGGPVPGRGAIVVGHGAVQVAAAEELATVLGWPVLSEPTGNARGAATSVSTYPLVLADAATAAELAPDVVVTVGKPGLSRSLLAWVASAGRQVVVDPRGRWADPLRTADVVLTRVPAPGRATTGPAERSWVDRWLAADAAARTAIDTRLDADDVLTEPRLARDLMAALPAGALLLAGSSRPVRDLEAYAAGRADITVVGNRGVSGIDGLLSTAVGAALVHDGPAYALLGDLAFLHDHGGLLLGPGETRPDLTVVVVDNDGGGIFSSLPPAGHPVGFERVFGTPHGLDLAAVAAAAGWPVTVVSRATELATALQGTGPRVVLVRTDRAAAAALQVELAGLVATAVRRAP